MDIYVNDTFPEWVMSYKSYNRFILQGVYCSLITVLYFSPAELTAVLGQLYWLYCHWTMNSPTPPLDSVQWTHNLWHKTLCTILLQKIYLWKILTMLAAEYVNQRIPIENNRYWTENTIIGMFVFRCWSTVFLLLCFCVDQPYVFYVYLLIRSTFSTTCVSCVHTYFSVFVFTCWSDLKV